MAVASMLSKPQPFATLDLRIDYVRPATTGEAVIAEAECYRITSNVAFTRAFAHHGDPSDPIAAASGTFMLATKGTPRTKETLIRADGGKGESA
jgi:acyl-coenzyme A thioesterase PaaI-like protein